MCGGDGQASTILAGTLHRQEAIVKRLQLSKVSSRSIAPAWLSPLPKMLLKAAQQGGNCPTLGNVVKHAMAAICSAHHAGHVAMILPFVLPVQAAGHWELALRVNPLHAEGWFALGFCALKYRYQLGHL